MKLVERYAIKMSDVLISRYILYIIFWRPRLCERTSLSSIIVRNRRRRRREKSISRAAIKCRVDPVAHALRQLHANIMSRRRRRRYLINTASSICAGGFSDKPYPRLADIFVLFRRRRFRTVVVISRGAAGHTYICTYTRTRVYVNTMRFQALQYPGGVRRIRGSGISGG